MLFSTVCIWSLHVRFSSIQTPKNIIEDSLLTVNPFRFRFGSRNEILSFLDDFWKKESLVFLTFNDNLLALNQLLTFVSSLFIFSNKTLMSLCQNYMISVKNTWIFRVYCYGQYIDLGDLVVGGISSAP